MEKGKVKLSVLLNILLWEDITFHFQSKIYLIQMWITLTAEESGNRAQSKESKVGSKFEGLYLPSVLVVPKLGIS